MKLELKVRQSIFKPDWWRWEIIANGKEYQVSNKSFKSSQDAIIDAIENSALGNEIPCHVAIIARK